MTYFRGPPREPSGAGRVGRGGARERAQFSPQAETELSGLCDDEGKDAPKEPPRTGVPLDSSPCAKGGLRPPLWNPRGACRSAFAGFTREENAGSITPFSLIKNPRGTAAPGAAEQAARAPAAAVIDAQSIPTFGLYDKTQKSYPIRQPAGRFSRGAPL